MNKFLAITCFLISFTLNAKIEKKSLKLEIEYYPKVMTWHLEKSQLGNVINQKMIFQGKPNKEYSMNVQALELVIDPNGTMNTASMIRGKKKNERSLVKYIQPMEKILIKKGERKEVSFKVKTEKDMNGCYFFGYYPKSTEIIPVDRKLKKGEKASAFNIDFKMVSGGFLHIKGTEKYQIKDDLTLKKGKGGVLLTYKFDFNGNCILTKPRFKIDVRDGNKVVFSKNNIKINEKSDRSFYPGMTNIELTQHLKLKKGKKYKIRITAYSDDSNFSNFFKIKESEIKM